MAAGPEMKAAYETAEAQKLTETDRVEISEAAAQGAGVEIAREQMEMDEGMARLDETEAERIQEQREMDEGALGYSSSYYEHEMAGALNSGNRVAYENARRHWAEEKAREETRIR